MVWVGSNLKDHPNPLDRGRETYHYIGLLRTPPSLALNTTKDGAFTAIPGNLFQCLTPLTLKSFFTSYFEVNLQQTQSLMTSEIVLQ